MTTNPKVKYLLFDHDGVLVDTEAWYYEATRRALAELDIELTLDRYRQHLVDGASSWNVALEAGFSKTEIESARSRRNAYYQHYLRTESIDIPGVIDVLETLSSRYEMAIVTTSKRDDFELIHEHRDIRGYMSFVLAREDYDRAKPHPEPYRTALDRFGGRAGDALVIEDSERGLNAAVAAGIPCAVVYNEFTAHQDLSAAQYELSSLLDLPTLLGCVT